MIRCQIILLSLACTLPWGASASAGLMTASIEGTFGAGVSVGGIDVSNETFRFESTIDAMTAIDDAADVNFGLFSTLNSTSLSSASIGTVQIAGTTKIEQINNFQDPGDYWFALDFPNSSTGIAAIFSSPIFGDPNTITAFSPSTALLSGQSIAIDNVVTSAGAISGNTATITSASVVPVIAPVPEPASVFAFFLPAVSLLQRRRKMR